MLKTLALTAALVAASSAQAKMGKCLLEVEGKPYLLGPCNIETEPDGSFSVGVATERNPRAASPYFAYVFKQETGEAGKSGTSEATATWNESPTSTHAHSPLGTLRRMGACWINETAKICAWR